MARQYNRGLLLPLLAGRGTRHAKRTACFCGLLVQVLLAATPARGGDIVSQEEAQSRNTALAGEAVLWQMDPQVGTRILKVDSATDSRGVVHVVFEAHSETEDMVGKDVLVHIAIRMSTAIAEQHPQAKVLSESPEAGASWAMTRDGTTLNVTWREQPGLYCVTEESSGERREVTSIRAQPPLDRLATVGYLRQTSTLLLEGSLPLALDEMRFDASKGIIAAVHATTNALVAVNVPQNGDVVPQATTLLRGDRGVKLRILPLLGATDGSISFCTVAVDQATTPRFQLTQYALGGRPLNARCVHQWHASGIPREPNVFFVGRRFIFIWEESAEIDLWPLYFIDSDRSTSPQILDPARDVRCIKPAGAFRDTATGPDGLVVWTNETGELVGRRYLRGNWSALLCFGITSGRAISIESIGEGRYWVFADAKDALRLYELRVSGG